MKIKQFACALYVTALLYTTSEAACTPSEEQVYKSLHTLKLTYYINVEAAYQNALAATTDQAQQAEIQNAYNILMNPVVKAEHELETFLDDFHLQAKEKKIDNFQKTYARYQGYIANLEKAYKEVYESSHLDKDFSSLEQQKAIGKALLKRRLAHSNCLFIDKQMTYFMDVAITERLNQENEDQQRRIDPTNALGDRQLKVVQANKELLKTLTSLPGWVQSFIRKTMAKKQRR